MRPRWWEVAAVKVDKAVSRAAVAATKAAVRKRAAAPSWSDLIAAFGEGGAQRNARGKVIGYKYPTPKDDADRARINKRVYEMWKPQYRLATEIGGAASAATEANMVKVKAADGTIRSVLPEKAEKVDRAVGNRARFGYSRAYSNAPFWRTRRKRA